MSVANDPWSLDAIVVEPKVISRVFEGFRGSVRLEFQPIDAILEQRALDPMDFARVLTRLMNWEEGRHEASGRGKCNQAHVVLARLRQGQPIGDDVYRAVLRVLAMSNDMIQTHVHSILTWTPMPKAGRLPSWDGR